MSALSWIGMAGLVALLVGVAIGFHRHQQDADERRDRDHYADWDGVE